MSRVLYIQHGEHDHPGLFATTLHQHGVPLEILHVWRGDPVPTRPEAWAGLVLGGGYMSAYQMERFPFLRDEIALIRAARVSRTPVLGLCLGAQLMAAALGGHVFPNRTKEIGFFDVRFEPAAETDALWQGHTATFQPVHWHEDTFSLPPQAVRLASSCLTANQLFRVDDTHYGMQFHLEIDALVLTEMVKTADGWLAENGVDPEGLLRTAIEALPKVEPIAGAVFTRWLTMLRTQP